MKNPINWFEIPVNDLKRAQKFYEHVFQIEITLNEMDKLKMGWFPFDPEGSGATGTLIQAETYVPSYDGTMVYFSVDEINDILPRIKEAGGKIINETWSNYRLGL